MSVPQDAFVYALDTENGELIWSYETGAEVSSAPAVGGGVVYVTSLDRHVYALAAENGGAALAVPNRRRDGFFAYAGRRRRLRRIA